MNISIKIISISILTIFISCQSKTNEKSDFKKLKYNDLNDNGYIGNIKSINTKFYSNIIKKQNIWVIKDSLQPRLNIIFNYNQDGNLTSKSIISEFKSSNYQLIYEYKDNNKIGWKRIDSNNEPFNIGKYIYYGDTGFSEIEYDLLGKQQLQSKIVLNKAKRTKTSESISYNLDSTISFHSLITYEDNENGYLHGFIFENKLTNQTDKFEMQVIESDKFRNPIKILVQKNGKPFEIRTSIIEYN